MNTVSLHDAQVRLPDLVHRLAPGESLTITEDGRPVAQITSLPLIRQRAPRSRPPVTGVPKAGLYEGRFTVPDDFKEPLDEMREYRE